MRSSRPRIRHGTGLGLDPSGLARVRSTVLHYVEREVVNHDAAASFDDGRCQDGFRIKGSQPLQVCRRDPQLSSTQWTLLLPVGKPQK
jgi:hypothetical protein